MFVTPILTTISMISALEILVFPWVIEPGSNRSLIQAEAMQGANPTIAPIAPIATLADGDYQVCSAPDPQDWQNGAGVCFVFNKIGDRVEGYYGYPHSDQFICLRGSVEANQITGEAFTLSWGGNSWESIPNTPFTWDDEGHLTLSQGSIARTAGVGDNRTDWILFRRALLGVDDFYAYAPPRMVTPAQLCNWNEL